MTLTEVAIVLGKTLKVVSANSCWRVAFNTPIEVMNHGGLLTIHGKGKTREEAKKDFAKMLNGRIVVSNAFSDNRQQIQLPPTITPN